MHEDNRRCIHRNSDAFVITREKRDFCILVRIVDGTRLQRNKYYRKCNTLQMAVSRFRSCKMFCCTGYRNCIKGQRGMGSKASLDANQPQCDAGTWSAVRRQKLQSDRQAEFGWQERLAAIPPVFCDFSTTRYFPMVRRVRCLLPSRADRVCEAYCTLRHEFQASAIEQCCLVGKTYLGTLRKKVEKGNTKAALLWHRS